jgi:hypothetical protein
MKARQASLAQQVAETEAKLKAATAAQVGQRLNFISILCAVLGGV